MKQQNRKRQHVEQEEEDNGNGNELREPEFKMAALEAKNGMLSAMANVKEENGGLGEKLKESEERAQMAAKNEESLDRHRRVPLPLELNCQIFACLKFESQRKFIGGLGRGIYGMFRQKVLTKSKLLRNPEQNGWEVSNTCAIISFNGLMARDNKGSRQTVYAKKGFPITAGLSRTDNFPGTILYYFEVTNMLSFGYFRLGLSSGNIPDGSWVGRLPNSYAIQEGGRDYCWLSGTAHQFERPNGAIEPWDWNGQRDAVGCGLVLNRANELFIFFTRNGILMGKQMPINSTANLLYPTVSMSGYGSVEANFGDDPAKPFSYDTKKCPGMVFE